MSGDILFDNLVISDDETVVREWAAQTFDLKRKQIDRQSVSTGRKFIIIFLHEN